VGQLGAGHVLAPAPDDDLDLLTPEGYLNFQALIPELMDPNRNASALTGYRMREYSLVRDVEHESGGKCADQHAL
jgi:hypothetical protein